MRSRASRIALGLAIAAVVLAVVITAATISFSGSDRICRDVAVSGVEIGGLTKARTVAKIEAWGDERVKRSVTLTALDVRWTGTLQDFGAKVDTRDALSRAFSVGRTGNIFRRAVCALTPWGGGKRIKARLVLDDSRTRATLNTLARQVDRPHRDAALRVVDNRLEIKPDGCGIKVNEENAARVVSRAVASGLAVVSLPVEVDRPDVTSNDAAGIDTLLSRFTTSFNPGKRGRTHNLTLASRTLSGIILKPGMRLSTNQTVGPRIMSRGFRTAQIFVKGKLEEGLGGGVCQVSSTLYNAVLLAGLKVLERGHHSRTVPYVTAGRDATVAYGLIDFRFENTNAAPIGLITHVKGSRLTVDIYGAAADKKEVKVYTSASRWTAAGAQTVTDASLSPGLRKLVEKGSRGVSVTVYRKIGKPDGKAVTEIISRDRYLPQKAVIAVGAAPEPQSPVAVTPAGATARGASAGVSTD